MPAALAHLLVLLAVSWIYLTLVRFVDVNEREPVWSLALAFVLGGAAAGLVRALVDPVTMVLSQWTGAAVEEVAKGIAFGVCLMIFAGIARIRGWFELNDLVDGMVYGIAIGLGYSLGDTFLRDLSPSPFPIEPIAFRPGASIVNGALGGLGHGLFGGVIGLGVGLAVEARRNAAKLILPIVGLAAAVALNGLFRVIAHGNALGGQAGLYRAWLVVIIPLIALVAIGMLGLARERKTIATQLFPEVEAGVVTPGDLALLGSFWKRQLQYLRLLGRGKLHECLLLAGRHNRHVQLALAKARALDERDAEPSASLRREIDALRRAAQQAGPLLVLLVVAGTAAAAVRRQLIDQENAEVTRVLGSAVPKLNEYWGQQVLLFFPPSVGRYSSLQTHCRYIRNNATFCGRDGNIYYDPKLLNELNDSIGDFAPVLVIAHEYGHKVQAARLSRADWPIKNELQADCYAGEWTRHAETRKWLDKGDFGEALAALNYARDPRYYPWSDSLAHGSAGQRVDAYTAGREGMSCRSDSLWLAVHLDPSASPQKATPSSGSLLDRVARVRGRFTMVNVKVLPDFIKGKRTDVIEATYKTPDGSQVVLRRGAYTSPDGAAADLVSDSTMFVGLRYGVTQQGQVKDGDRVVGRWIQLNGEYEAVILTNLQIYDLIFAGKGLAWEFATSKVP